MKLIDIYNKIFDITEKSDSARYYENNPEARKVKAKTDKKINSKPEQVTKRVEANKARRQAKASGKNVTGKDIILKKTSLFCYKMYSDEITWSIVTASDSNALQDIWASASPEQDLIQTNEDSGTGIGIGNSDYSSNITLDADNWIGLIINSITAGSASDKRFQALFHYDAVQP